MTNININVIYGLLKRINDDEDFQAAVTDCEIIKDIVILPYLVYVKVLSVSGKVVMYHMSRKYYSKFVTYFPECNYGLFHVKRK